MSTKQQRARKRLTKWRDNRFKFREISKVTGVSSSMLCTIINEDHRVFSDDVADRILKAKEP